MIVYNYFASPPVGFKNIRGHYLASDGPIDGCILLLQPGAGINVFGHVGGKEKETPDLTGQVKGTTFSFNYKVGGESKPAALDVSKSVFIGTGEHSSWTWSKSEDCS